MLGVLLQAAQGDVPGAMELLKSAASLSRASVAVQVRAGRGERGGGRHAQQQSMILPPTRKGLLRAERGGAHAGATRVSRRRSWEWE